MTEMTENLNEMVEDSQAFSPEDLVLPEASEGEATAEVVEEASGVPTISIASLSEWFEANNEAFDNINEVKVAIRGIDSAKTLIMAVKDGSADDKDEEGNEKRSLRTFENADLFPVLNIPACKMDVYNKGFQIQYDYNEDTSIKCYGIKQGLIVVFCSKVGDQLIPYNVSRLTRKDTELEYVAYEGTDLQEKLAETTNLEDLEIRYKQSSKAEDLTTNQTAVNWLLTRQSGIMDINHLLQIDNAIIGILG
jgi:uncharacterized protein YigA (DUF484 family)